MVKLMAARANGFHDRLLAERLAHGTAGGLDDQGQSPAHGVGVRGTPSQRTTWMPLWRRRLGSTDGKAFWDGIDFAASGTA